MFYYVLPATTSEDVLNQAINYRYNESNTLVLAKFAEPQGLDGEMNADEARAYIREPSNRAEWNGGEEPSLDGLGED